MSVAQTADMAPQQGSMAIRGQARSHLVIIGAGHGEELDSHASDAYAQIILVEPNPKLAESLRQRFQGAPHVQVLEQAIVANPRDGRQVTLQEYNWNKASSVHPPADLLTLLPGIQAVALHRVKAVTPQALIDELSLPEDAPHALIVKAPGEGQSIVSSLLTSRHLAQFDRVHIHYPVEGLYGTQTNTPAMFEQLDSHGFEIEQEDTSDPDWPILTLIRNPWKQALQVAQEELEQHKQKAQDQTDKFSRLEKEKADLEKAHEALKAEKEQDRQALTTLEKELEQHKQKAQDQTDKFSRLEKEKADLQKAHETLKAQQEQGHQELTTLKEELEKYKGYFADRKKQHEQAETQLAEKTQELEARNEEIKALHQQLASQQQAFKDEQSRLNQLENKLQTLFSEQHQQIQQTANALGQHVTRMARNTSRQLDAQLGLQSYLTHGETPLNDTEGARLCPEVALNLVQCVERHAYDLIITFGNGQATCLLARAIVNPTLQRHPQGANRQLQHLEDDERPTQHHIAPSSRDLPQRIVAFEHDKGQRDRTAQALQHHGLSQVVDLVHAPLVEITLQGEGRLFHACEDKLRHVARQLEGREAQILVWVGNTLADAGHSRYPALHQILQTLAPHTLDVVLEDPHQPHEDTLTDQWRELLKARQRHWSESEWPGQPGTWRLQIPA